MIRKRSSASPARRALAAMTALAIAVIGLVLWSAAPANATPGPGVHHTVRNVAAESLRTSSWHPDVDVCLDADLNTIGRNGTKVQLWDCNDTSQQNWYYEPVAGTGAAVIKNHQAGSGYCLDADLNTIGRNGTKVQLWGCNGSTQQLWTGFGTPTLKNVRAGSGYCLDADLNTIQSNGTKMQLWGCNGSQQQSWWLSVPFNHVCKTYTIGGAGRWEIDSTGGQGIHVQMVNASLSSASISVTSDGFTAYLGVLDVNQTVLFDTSLFGTPPLTYHLIFAVNGPNIGRVGVSVRSSVC